jgi:drug/metabolite transporter (DMT)-like permease
MIRAFSLVLVAVIFSASGELMLKHGMNQVGVLSLPGFLPTLGRAVRNPFVLGGFASIGTGALFWLAAISRVSLSWAYPMLSMGYIYVLLFSAIILRENVSWIRWLGAIVICLGVFLIWRS